jgi:CelD/BcsL family acetyltransferase involved in cellulose biosynthesis
LVSEDRSNRRMNVYQLNPVEDPRWAEFVRRHPSSSVFHTPQWLAALQRTYDYLPVAFTASPPGRDLANGLVFCEVKSWLSGPRLVSLPFSDHCQPLVDAPEITSQLVSSLKRLQHKKNWKYIELRPLFADDSAVALNGDLAPSESYSWQVLDLKSDLDVLFRRFHKSCIQRKIHRAEREQLRYEEGRSEALLAKFYFLLILTRRRHGLPPQPLAWFRNLLSCLGEKMLIRVAYKGDDPVASIITISHKKSLVYKYGCSDARFNNLGGTPLLFWKAIQDAKRDGAEEYDLGRSESGNSGLVAFKENFGAATFPLHYYRLPPERSAHKAWEWRSRVARNIFSKMPESVLTATGRLLYRHIG